MPYGDTVTIRKTDFIAFKELASRYLQILTDPAIKALTQIAASAQILDTSHKTIEREENG